MKQSDDVNSKDLTARSPAAQCDLHALSTQDVFYSPLTLTSLCSMKRGDYSNRTKSYSITAQGYWLYSKLNNYVAGQQWQMCMAPVLVACAVSSVGSFHYSETGREATVAYLLPHTHTCTLGETHISYLHCISPNKHTYTSSACAEKVSSSVKKI